MPDGEGRKNRFRHLYHHINHIDAFHASSHNACERSTRTMARVTVEDCLKEVNNRFLLVMLASKRVKQLYKGSTSLIENKGNNKNVVIALREVASGKLQFQMMTRKSR